MGKSSRSSSRTTARNDRVMSSNSNRRARPMVPKAGVTTHRSRYSNGGRA